MYVFACIYTLLGLTDDLLQQLRGNVPNTMLADLKDSLRNGRSLNLQDSSGATAVSWSVVPPVSLPVVPSVSVPVMLAVCACCAGCVCLLCHL